MNMDVNVDIEPKEVLDEMKVKDIIKYIIEEREYEFTEEDLDDINEYIAKNIGIDSSLTEMLLDKLDSWEILTAIAAPYTSHNCTDKQSVLDGLQEYLSRL